MHSSAVFAFSLLFLKSTVFGSALPVDDQSPNGLVNRATTTSKCNADNCYRVMTNTLSVATPFCSTYLQSTTVITIQQTVTISGTVTIQPPAITPIPSQVYPAHLTSQCLLTTAPALSVRLSSACSCLPTPIVAQTVTSTSLLPAATSTIPVANPSNCADYVNPVLNPKNGEKFYMNCHGAYDGGCLSPPELDGQCWGSGQTFGSCFAICEAHDDCTGFLYDPNYFGEGQSGCAPTDEIGESSSSRTPESGVIGAVRSDQCIQDLDPALAANCQ